MPKIRIMKKSIALLGLLNLLYATWSVQAADNLKAYPPPIQA